MPIFISQYQVNKHVSNKIKCAQILDGIRLFLSQYNTANTKISVKATNVNAAHLQE